MVWLVIGILAGLVIGFAYAAEKLKRRADFWEHAYLQKAGNLEALLDGVEKYAGHGEGVLRVWPREELYH